MKQVRGCRDRGNCGSLKWLHDYFKTSTRIIIKSTEMHWSIHRLSYIHMYMYIVHVHVVLYRKVQAYILTHPISWLTPEELKNRKLHTCVATNRRKFLKWGILKIMEVRENVCMSYKHNLKTIITEVGGTLLSENNQKLQVWPTDTHVGGAS